MRDVHTRVMCPCKALRLSYCCTVQLLGFIYTTTKVMDLALQIARMVLDHPHIQAGRRVQLLDKPAPALC